jgi:hypothetical protein
LYPKVPNPLEQCSSTQREEDAEAMRKMEDKCSHQVSKPFTVVANPLLSNVTDIILLAPKIEGFCAASRSSSISGGKSVCSNTDAKATITIKTTATSTKAVPVNIFSFSSPSSS